MNMRQWIKECIVYVWMISILFYATLLGCLFFVVFLDGMKYGPRILISFFMVALSSAFMIVSFLYHQAGKILE